MWWCVSSRQGERYLVSTTNLFCSWRECQELTRATGTRTQTLFHTQHYDHMMPSSLYFQAAKCSKWFQLIIFLHWSKRTKDGVGTLCDHQESTVHMWKLLYDTPVSFQSDPGEARRERSVCIQTAFPSWGLVGLLKVAFGDSAGLAHTEPQSQSSYQPPCESAVFSP